MMTKKNGLGFGNEWMEGIDEEEEMKGRDVSGQYGRKDETFPVSTGGGPWIPGASLEEGDGDVGAGDEEKAVLFHAPLGRGIPRALGSEAVAQLAPVKDARRREMERPPARPREPCRPRAQRESRRAWQGPGDAL